MVKKLFSVGLGLCLMFGLAGVARGNELNDGGFEAGQNLGSTGSAWTTEGKDTAVVSIENAGAHSGSHCAKITNPTAGDRASLVQKYHLEQFAHYELSAWLKSSQPGMAVQFDLHELKGPRIPVAIKTFTVGRQWQQVSIRGIAPDTVDGEVSISADAQGSFFVDDVSLTHTGPATVDVPAAIAEPIDPLYFGMHYHEGPIHTAYLPELSPKYLRLWDDHVAWTHLEPAKGKWDFSRLDAIVAHAPPDVRIILMLGQTPAWASTHPQTKGAYGYGSAYMCRDIQNWRDYLQTVGTRYKGRIKYWEVWNECNWRTFWLDGVSNMVKLTHEAHEVLKTIDPNNMILSPGFTKDLGEDFINQWFYEGAGKDVDVISYHFYPTPSVDAAFVMAQDVMELKKSYGFEKLPLWNTEYGEKRKFRQAPILGEMNVLYFFSGMQQLDYYTYDDKAFGLTAETSGGRFNSTRLNAAGVAYAQTRQWTLGATPVVWSILPDRTHYVEYSRPGGYRCFAVWRTPAKSAPQNPALPHEGMVPEDAMVAEDAVKPTPFEIPAEWHVTAMRDLAGNQRAVEEGTILISDAPVLLENQSK